MSPSLRRMVVLMVLLAILVFDWRPDSRLLSEPAHRREEERPLPEDTGSVASQAARSPRSAHLETGRQRLPGLRQAARRRHPPR